MFDLNDSESSEAQPDEAVQPFLFVAQAESDDEDDEEEYGSAAEPAVHNSAAGSIPVQGAVTASGTSTVGAVPRPDAQLAAPSVIVEGPAVSEEEAAADVAAAAEAARAAAAAEAEATRAAREAAADAAEAEGRRMSRRVSAGQAPVRYEEVHVKAKKKVRARESKTELPREAAVAAINSEWVQCDLCQKWRIVKCSDIDQLEEDKAWICSMNADVRHNVRVPGLAPPPPSRLPVVAGLAAS